MDVVAEDRLNAGEVPHLFVLQNLPVFPLRAANGSIAHLLVNVAKALFPSCRDPRGESEGGGLTARGRRQGRPRARALL